MRVPRTLSLLFVAALGACDNPKPVVVLNGYGNVLWCRQPTVPSSHQDTCLSEARDFEVDIATQVAVDPECKGVLFVSYAGPNEQNNKTVLDAMLSPHWTLNLNFRPGAQKQHWSVLRTADPGDLAFAQGDDGPTDIAKKVCAIAKQRGGAIVN